MNWWMLDNVYGVNELKINGDSFKIGDWNAKWEVDGENIKTKFTGEHSDIPEFDFYQVDNGAYMNVWKEGDKDRS